MTRSKNQMIEGSKLIRPSLLSSITSTSIISIVFLFLHFVKSSKSPQIVLFLSLLLSGHEVVDGFSLFKGLLHGDEKVDAVDDKLHQLDLGEAQSVGVGDVEGSSHGRSVDATRSALLQPQVLENLICKEEKSSRQRLKRLSRKE